MLDRKLMSISPRLFSALLPTWSAGLFAASDFQGWITIAISIPTGKPVNLLQVLLAVQDSAAQHLADLVDAQLDSTASSGECFANAVNGGISSQQFLALTPNGLAVGLDQGEAQYAVCGRTAVMIPYDKLVKYLTPYGRSLVSLAGQAHFFSPPPKAFVSDRLDGK